MYAYDHDNTTYTQHKFLKSFMVKRCYIIHKIDALTFNQAHTELSWHKLAIGLDANVEARFDCLNMLCMCRVSTDAYNAYTILWSHIS